MNWKLTKEIAIGGLINVGFISNSSLLIIVSHNGRGIFNCLTGERLARNYDDIWQVFDDETGEVKGFDISENQIVQTHGLFGGDNLPKMTEDGWSLEMLSEINIKKIILNSPDKISTTVGDNSVTEIKAFGFSEDENFFIIANDSDFTIYQREND